MSRPRRKRRNTKGLDAMKLAGIILCLLLGVTLVLWLGMQLLRPKEPLPEFRSQPGRSMWESPPAAR